MINWTGMAAEWEGEIVPKVNVAVRKVVIFSKLRVL